MKILSLVSFVFFPAILCAAHATAATTPPKGAVLTWHDDNFRTGWQQQETILTTSTASKLGIAHAVTLKDQVDAQPLVIPSFINGHDIVFVADESNNVYQIDASTGAILRQVNLGAPVPFPLRCDNNGPNVGINSTPVIDWASRTLFVIAYVNVNSATPTYFLHALDLNTLADKVSPLKVAASHTPTSGAAITFLATNQRQRAGLLLANGKVYAAFTSFCDFHASPSNPTGQPSRGWVLGWNWNGTALTALPANQLEDRQPSSPTNYFLDTIWMSGAGPAGDESGDVIFATGNSDGSAVTTSTWTGRVANNACLGTATGTVPTAVPCSNVQEGVVKLTGDLRWVNGLFSPNGNFGVFSPDTLALDQHDSDLGSGGVLLVPRRGSAYLAAVAGKDGRLFLLDRSWSSGLKFLQLRQGSPCFCAPSYFTGPDGVGRIVASQGNVVQTFEVPVTTLSPEGTSSGLTTGQDPGFMTTVSCAGSGEYGNCTNTPIIWAVSRPVSSAATDVDLYAFSGLAVGGSYPLLLGPMKVGYWPNLRGNANIVPTVAHGLVYVASNKLLTILKEGGTGALPSATPAAAAEAALPATGASAAAPASAFSISGTLRAINGAVLTLTDRDGKDRLIDSSEAATNGLVTAGLTVGEAYTAVGSSLASAGMLRADAIYRAKCRRDDAGACAGDQWPPDKD
jgi:hypothetical protein